MNKPSITLVVDTREKLPWAFPSLQTVTYGLPAGDYSVQGFETRIAVERKTLDDFVQTVIGARDRFHAELKRLSAYEAACVVVEGNICDITAHKYKSGASPQSVLGAMLSIICDWKVPVFFWGDRQHAQLLVSNWLTRQADRLSNNKNEVKK